jgi:DinB family
MSSTGSVNIGKQVLVTELNYTAWANTILLRACEKLTTEELNRDLGGSHSSVIRTLRHIYDGERSWVHNLITSSIPLVADMDAAGAPISPVLTQRSKLYSSHGPKSGRTRVDGSIPSRKKNSSAKSPGSCAMEPILVFLAGKSSCTW